MIAAEQLTKTYPGDVRALDQLDLRVEPGELLAVVGPSGSGKSTMLHIFGTLDRPTAGTLRIAGYDVARLSDNGLAALRAQAIGFVFQQFHLAPGTSAIDNVGDGLLYSGRSVRDRKRAAAQALNRVGLGHRAGHQSHQLSGGEKQRVAIARAIVGEPRLVLADEPTGSLDTATGAGVMALLRGLHADGTTVVVITHDRDIAASLPRRVHLQDGRVVSDERTEGVPR